MRSLHISYAKLPPSDNAIRGMSFRFFGGKRNPVICYTKEAIDYKKGLIRHINDSYFVEVQQFARGHKPHMLYLLSFVLTFPPKRVLNIGWLEKNGRGERGAQSPYKRIDVMNHRKLVEDCLSEAIGIDDSLFWESGNVKVVSPNESCGLDLTLEEMDPRHYGVPTEYLC